MKKIYKLHYNHMYQALTILILSGAILIIVFLTWTEKKWYLPIFIIPAICLIYNKFIHSEDYIGFDDNTITIKSGKETLIFQKKDINHVILDGLMIRRSSLMWICGKNQTKRISLKGMIPNEKKNS